MLTSACNAHRDIIISTSLAFNPHRLLTTLTLNLAILSLASLTVLNVMVLYAPYALLDTSSTKGLVSLTVAPTRLKSYAPLLFLLETTMMMRRKIQTMAIIGPILIIIPIIVLRTDSVNGNLPSARSMIIRNSMVAAHNAVISSQALL